MFNTERRFHLGHRGTGHLELLFSGVPLDLEVVWGSRIYWQRLGMELRLLHVAA